MQIPVYLMALAALEPQSKVLGGGYYSLKEAKRKGGFAMQTLGKTPLQQIINRSVMQKINGWLLQILPYDCQRIYQYLAAGEFPAGAA